MRVLHVIPSLGPQRGGPSYILPLLARSLQQSGVAVEIATTDDDGSERLSVPPGYPVLFEGVTTHFFSRQAHFYTFSLPLAAWLWTHIAAYDLVHIHALFSFAALPAALGAQRRNVPYIVRPLGTLNHYGREQRRPQLKRVSYRFIEHPILEHAAAIHYTSEQERAEAADLRLSRPSAVIPLGIDLSSFDALPSPESFLTRHPELRSRPSVLFLSRSDPKKGLDLLLPAFADAAPSDAALVIAGRGNEEYTAALRRQSADLGITDRITWTGHLSGEQKLAAFAAATVFVLPSYSENFGIAAVEALAAGTPTLVSTGVAVASDIRSHDAGVVVGPNTTDLAEGLRRLLSSESLRAGVSRRGRDLARDKFSRQTAAERTRDLYRGILSGGGLTA